MKWENRKINIGGDNLPEVHVRGDSLGPAELLLRVVGGAAGRGDGVAAAGARRGDVGAPGLAHLVLKVVVPLVLLGKAFWALFSMNYI